MTIAKNQRNVLLIHGFPLAGEMWRPQLEFLAAHGWNGIAPDLPGFGRNSSHSLPAATIDAYADAVMALLDQQQLERAVVAGMSMGGYILLNLLARFRERFSAAVFVATRAEADDLAGKERRTALAAAARAGGSAEVIGGFDELLVAPGTVQTNPELLERVRRWMKQASAEGLATALLAMRDRPDYRERLAEFDLPALVAGGGADQLLGPAPYQVLLAGLPRAEGCLLNGAGHLLNQEQPQAFNRCLLKFLDRLEL
ncbi:alpha/beta fold hydrolase [Desulfuromonas sp. DDH964]|nr:alpha/beta hydrolase [Desulfuromonas sp. DDH964]AMV73335.1 alpha/beta fold family hydrolase [Desulfuromonas sp. DDH964]